jgi:phosphatidylserine/phosphatidylglycerophosphate/cardiolipin synthase-like enzyme
MLDPRSERPRLVFSSGNMSSGTVLHHENWHFVALPAETHFAQAHLCLMDGLLEHASSKGEYSSFVRSCRGAIEHQEERDLKVFFIPGEGDKAFNRMQKGLRGAERIDIAAHRFTYKGLMSNLRRRLDAGDAEVRLVVDDDLWWAGKGQIVGGNDGSEWATVAELTGKGLDARFMETNHGEHLLHHNKFLIFDMPDGGEPDAIFAGSGNFTGSAFSDNFENFYWTSIPHVVDAFKAQYERLHAELATAPADMPTTLVAPEGEP